MQQTLLSGLPPNNKTCQLANYPKAPNPIMLIIVSSIAAVQASPPKYLWLSGWAELQRLSPHVATALAAVLSGYSYRDASAECDGMFKVP